MSLDLLGPGFSSNSSSHQFSDADFRWWAQPTESGIAQSLTSLIHRMRADQESRFTRYRIADRVYDRTAYQSGFGGTGYGFQDMRSYFSAVQSAIDTVLSKMSRARPRPYMMTNGGKHKSRSMAKKLNRFLLALFNQAGVYVEAPKALRDSMMYGDGYLHVYERDNKIICERVTPGEIFVDSQESLFAKPRQMHRVRAISRDVAVSLWPTKKQIIESASRITYINNQTFVSEDLILLRESWRLKSSPKASDGVYCVSLDSGLLEDPQQWDYDFPFARITYSDPVVGYYGTSAVSQVLPLQIELNELSMLVQRSFQISGTFKIFVPIGSSVSADRIDNDLGTILEYDGPTPPTWVVPEVIPPQMLSRMMTLKQEIYEQIGASQLAASGLKPEGLNSGAALREYSDIQSERFYSLGAKYQQLFTDVGLAALTIAKGIAHEDGNYALEGPWGIIEWKDVALGENSFDIQCYSSALLPTEPAGRLARISELAQEGYLPPEEARRLNSYPDLTQEEDLANASEEYLLMVLDEIRDDGIFRRPEMTDNLVLAEKLTLQYIQDSKLHKYQESTINMLEDFLEQVRDLMPPPEMPIPQDVPLPEPGASELPPSFQLESAPAPLPV